MGESMSTQESTLNTSQEGLPSKQTSKIANAGKRIAGALSYFRGKKNDNLHE